jgi:uncharacterized protein (TIGR00251 family)
MGLIITVKVVPSAGRQAWAVEDGMRLKCFLKSAPEKGKANKELIKLLADACSISQQQVHILQGETTRLKRILIDAPFTFEQLVAQLDPSLEFQSKLT